MLIKNSKKHGDNKKTAINMHVSHFPIDQIAIAQNIKYDKFL